MARLAFPLVPVSVAARRFLVDCAKRLYLVGFHRLWVLHSRFPERINLSLSLHCPANCVFCPDRAPQVFPKTMPMALLRKILQEAEDHGFGGPFSLSENGEGLTHPQFPEILLEIRRRFPKNGIILFSNMVLMDESRAKVLLEHGLTELHCNLDGATERTYEYVKQHKKYSLVRQNIARFAELRNEMNSPCTMDVGFITAKQFAEEIEGKQGVFEDDAQAIVDSLTPLLRGGDRVHRLSIMLHKYQSLLNHRRSEPCEQFYRVLREIFIAPNGQAYVCCLDFGNSSNLGNINERTIAEVWSGRLRERALRSIYQKRYEGAFDVCRTCPPSTGHMYSTLKRRLRTALKGVPEAPSGLKA